MAQWSDDEQALAQGFIVLRRQLSDSGRWCMDRFVDGLELNLDMNLVVKSPANKKYPPSAQLVPGKLDLSLLQGGSKGFG